MYSRIHGPMLDMMVYQWIYGIMVSEAGLINLFIVQPVHKESDVSICSSGFLRRSAYEVHFFEILHI